MNCSSANCPQWLAERIVKAGGIISFHQYMDWALNDADHGAYSAGHLKLGKKGDFATSPSMGADFAELLAVQLVDWFQQLQSKNVSGLPLSLIEVGPGEGDLAFQLIRVLEEIAPSIVTNLELVMVDINKGMISKQRKLLSAISTVPVRWSSLEDLSRNPVVGIILANEILDALPVERITFRDAELYRQGVKVEFSQSLPKLTVVDLPLPSLLSNCLVEIQDLLDIKIPPSCCSNGWNTELHTGLRPWLNKASKSLLFGSLLIVDYALEAHRYYNSVRSSGTIMCYKSQVASPDFFYYPGQSDITSHLCIDTLKLYAFENKWKFIGEVRQGQALLALGLAERLNSLQRLPSSQLDVALSRRENLLRLVDPAGLGDFRWFAFEIDNVIESNEQIITLDTRFLSNSPELF